MLSWCWGRIHREIGESGSEYCNTLPWTPSHKNKAGVALTENKATEVTSLHSIFQLNTLTGRAQKGTAGKMGILFVVASQSRLSRILNGVPVTNKKYHHDLYMDPGPTLVRVLL